MVKRWDRPEEKLTTMCSWHLMWHGREFRIAGPRAKPGHDVSHGLCRRCAKRFREEGRREGDKAGIR